MPDVPVDALGAVGDDDAVDQELVERERAELREFVAELSGDDNQVGPWVQLSAQALSSYTDKVDWHCFQERYAGVLADVILNQRMKMAARYAVLEGGISAGAYSAAIAGPPHRTGATAPRAPHAGRPPDVRLEHAGSWGTVGAQLGHRRS
jgi:hypothetical protein